MIADLDETIRQLLVTELPILEDEIEIKFDQPKREWSSRLSKPTINMFMYDMRENVRLRAQQWERQQSKNGARSHIVARKRTPVRIDCQYMLSCWAVEPEDEHNLMSAATMCLLPRLSYKCELWGPINKLGAMICCWCAMVNWLSAMPIR